MNKILRASIVGGTPLSGTVMLASDGVAGGANINDATVSTASTWSSEKIQTELNAIEMSGCPIEYVESLDTDNMVNLRDLETAPYVLYGYFSPYANSDMSLTFDNTIVVVARKAAGSHLLVLTGLNSKINFLEILVDESAPGGHAFTRTDFDLLDMHNKLNGAAATIGEVTLLAANWVGDASPYSQVVNIAGVTANSQVDLTPSVEQLVVFHEKDLTFVTENEDGTVTVYAIGQRPENDYTIQVTIKEVAV